MKPLLDSGRLMRPLAAIERLIERLVERPSGRLFRAHLEPVRIERRIERAMELERRSNGERMIVPDRFAVRLHPSDVAELGQISGSLAERLSGEVLDFARSHRYLVAARPQVEIVADAAIAEGEIAVTARFSEASPDRSDPVHSSPFAGGGHPGGRPTIEHTAVFAAVRPAPSSAVLNVRRADGSTAEVALDGRPVTVGRGEDNDVVLADPAVSRHHARFHSRQGTIVLTDLESRNGTFVNDVAIAEAILGPGDRVRFGGATFVVDRPAGPAPDDDHRPG